MSFYSSKLELQLGSQVELFEGRTWLWPAARDSRAAVVLEEDERKIRRSRPSKFCYLSCVAGNFGSVIIMITQLESLFQDDDGKPAPILIKFAKNGTIDGEIRDVLKLQVNQAIANATQNKHKWDEAQQQVIARLPFLDWNFLHCLPSLTFVTTRMSHR